MCNVGGSSVLADMCVMSVVLVFLLTCVINVTICAPCLSGCMAIISNRSCLFGAHAAYTNRPTAVGVAITSCLMVFRWSDILQLRGLL